MPLPRRDISDDWLRKKVTGPGVNTSKPFIVAPVPQPTPTVPEMPPVQIEASQATALQPLSARPAPPPLPLPGDSEAVVQAKMAAALQFYTQAYQNDGSLIQSLDSERRAWVMAYNASQQTVSILAKAGNTGTQIGNDCASVRQTYESMLSTANQEILREQAEIQKLRGQRNSAGLLGLIVGNVTGAGGCFLVNSFIH